MVVLDYEINLSKTEYLYYLECPQKFRLHRILNPIPYKTTFMNTKRSTSNYVLRNCSEDDLNGIIKHSFFETFHKKYWNRITEPEPPKEIASNQIKLLFWLYQQRKYFEDTDYWIPVQTELRLMTERQRGIIDCVELCKNKIGLRIIDYKSEPHQSDKLALVFYANLLNAFRAENKEYDEFLYDVVEIGCYYYESGIMMMFELKVDELFSFQESYQQILSEISQEKFPLIETSCWNCRLTDVCKIEKRRR